MTTPDPAATAPSPSQSLPPGWVETTLGELNTYKSANLDPADFPNKIFELYSVPTFPSGKPELQEGKDIGSTKQTIKPDDVLRQLGVAFSRNLCLAEKCTMRACLYELATHFALWGKRRPVHESLSTPNRRVLICKINPRINRVWQVGEIGEYRAYQVGIQKI